MKKILFTSHTANFSKFNVYLMKFFYSQGWEVHYASMQEEPIKGSEFCTKEFKVPFARSPFSISNIKAISILKKIILKENYTAIHTHTPMGSVVTRLAANNSRKKGTTVFYTAHGFHFFKGASFKNWLMYFPVEKLLSHYTDCLITINNEDNNNAKKYHFHCPIKQIHGAGFNQDLFFAPDSNLKSQLRIKNGFSDNDFILICVAEFTKNKNQQFLITNAIELKKLIPNLKLVFAGTGTEYNKCKKLAENLDKNSIFCFMGYRDDVPDLYKCADILVTASLREGLAVNIMEAQASGLPIVSSDTRGQRDLIQNGRNGFLYQINNQNEFRKKILYLYDSPKLRSEISSNNILDSKKYSKSESLKESIAIYKEFLSI